MGTGICSTRHPLVAVMRLCGTHQGHHTLGSSLASHAVSETGSLTQTTQRHSRHSPLLVQILLLVLLLASLSLIVSNLGISDDRIKKSCEESLDTTPAPRNLKVVCSHY